MFVTIGKATHLQEKPASIPLLLRGLGTKGYAANPHKTLTNDCHIQLKGRNCSLLHQHNFLGIIRDIGDGCECQVLGVEGLFALRAWAEHIIHHLN